MKTTIYDYQDYRRYLRDWIETQGRGEPTRLAKALRCHLTYLSQILSGKSQLSPEQAETLNSYFGHSEGEAEFFLMLVLHDRSGTEALREYYSRQLGKALERRLNLKDRLHTQKGIGKEEQATYYSAWYYLATHLLLGIPEYQDKKKIAKHLAIAVERVSEIIEFLVSSGLVIEKEGRYERGSFTIHLGNDSPSIRKHHTNWKLQALLSLDREQKDELHYSSVVTIARVDALKIKAALIEAIERVREVVKPSKEEALFCYTLDFFEVRNG